MIYFLPSQIPALQSFSHKERLAFVTQALALLSPTERIVMNVIKLLLITPVFLLLARFDGWHMLPWLILAGLAYPILVIPVRHWFALRHLDEVIPSKK